MTFVAVRHSENLVVCNVCGKLLDTGTEERCWFCNAPLCYDCWDKYGHCGHRGADMINMHIRTNIHIADHRYEDGADS